MTIALIVAASENNVIGRNNQLPWYLPGDLQYFKAMTLGKPVSRQKDYSAEGIKLVSSLDEAIILGESINLINGVKEVMVIGGAQIYAEALELADRVYLTRVHGHVEGDAYFPALDTTSWHETGREDILAKRPNPFNFSYLVLDRT
jgi:dihydrofolate reductase